MRYKGRIIGLALILLYILETIIFHDYMRLFDYITISVFTIIGLGLGLQFDQLTYASERDFLTKLYNRRYVYATFPKWVKHADRSQTPITVMVIDVDRFKEINDRCGHEVGDVVLEIISDVLTEHAGKRDVVARWGGDEFVILARLIHQLDSKDMIEQLQEKLEELSRKVNIQMQVSIGLAIYPTDETTLHGLLQMADQRMYTNKREKEVSYPEGDAYET